MRDLFGQRIAEFGEILNQVQNDVPEILDFSGHRPISHKNCPVARRIHLAAKVVLDSLLRKYQTWSTITDPATSSAIPTSISPEISFGRR